MFRDQYIKQILITAITSAFLTNCASANIITAARDGNYAVVQEKIQKLEKKQDIDAANTDKKSINVILEPEFNALHAACYHGRLDIVKLLVESGADIHKLDNHQGSPFLKALASGNPDVVEYLLQKGANINAMTEITGNPLHFVLQFFNRKKKKNEATFQPIRVALLKILSPRVKGIVNDLNKEGLPALFFTADGEKIPEAEILLKSGAKLSVVDKTYGNSVLHYAAHNQSLTMVKFFAEKGASINAKNKEGGTPLDFARAYAEKSKSYVEKVSKYEALARVAQSVADDAQEIVKYLESRGAKPGVQK